MASGDRLQGGDVCVGLVVAGEPGVCGERRVSLLWSPGARHGDHSDVAESCVQ